MAAFWVGVEASTLASATGLNVACELPAVVVACAGGLESAEELPARSTALTV